MSNESRNQKERVQLGSWLCLWADYGWEGFHAMPSKMTPNVCFPVDCWRLPLFGVVFTEEKPRLARTKAMNGACSLSSTRGTSTW